MLHGKLDALKKQLSDLEEWLKLVKKGKKVPTKENDDSKLVEALAENVSDANIYKESARTDADKLQAVKALDEAKAAQKADRRSPNFTIAHMYASQPSEDSLLIVSKLRYQNNEDGDGY